jgi:hypothetical protein
MAIEDFLTNCKYQEGLPLRPPYEKGRFLLLQSKLDQRAGHSYLQQARQPAGHYAGRLQGLLELLLGRTVRQRRFTGYADVNRRCLYLDRQRDPEQIQPRQGGRDQKCRHL